MEALKSSNKSLETTVKLNENNFKFQAKKESSDLCVCNNPKEEKNVFYIGCDICEKWYHGKCVRINEDFSKFIDKYFCFRCINNKTPTQGKCILKNHIVNNNEIYINPLDLNDPNMYYGYNPNKSAATSRQKKLESNKLKIRAEKIDGLSKKLQDNLLRQEEINNELKNLSKKIKSQNSEKSTKKISRKADNKQKSDTKIEKRSKSDKTSKQKKIDKKIKSSKKIDKNKNSSNSDKEDKIEVKRKEKPDIESRKPILEATLYKLKRQEAELKILLSDKRTSVVTEKSVKSLNKDFDNFMSQMAPQTMFKTENRNRTEFKPKKTDFPKKRKVRKTERKQNFNLKESSAKGAFNKSYYYNGIRKNFPPPPPLNATQFGNHSKINKANLKNSNVAKFDIFNMGKFEKPGAMHTSDFEKPVQKEEIAQFEERVDKIRNSAKEMLNLVPGLNKEMVEKLENEIYNSNFNRCNFWYDNIDLHKFDPKLESEEIFEKKDEILLNVVIKSNPYTRTINMLLQRLNKFKHFRYQIINQIIPVQKVPNLTYKNVNEIEKIGRYRKRTKEHFVNILGTEKGEKVENEIYKNFGGKNMKKYTTKSRELIFNLRKNENLVENVQNGNIPIVKLISMTHLEMASPEQNQWREKVQKEMLKEKVRDKTITETYKKNLKMQNKIPLENDFAANEKQPKIVQEFEIDENADQSLNEQKMEIKPKRRAVLTENKLLETKRYFESDLYSEKSNFLYSEKSIWNGFVDSYHKPRTVSLKEFKVSFYQIGGPKIEKFPFHNKQKLKMIGRSDVPRIAGYLNEILKNQSVRKIPVAFEVRPQDENIIDNYSAFCSYFMAVKRCAVFETKEKDFVMYFVPPDSEMIAYETVKKIFSCEPPEGCLWAFGLFNDENVYRKYVFEKDKQKR